MEMVLDKKQILAIFKFSFKMGHKAAEITCNINKTFAPGTGEGNGNPLQYSCLENPMDAGAWWVAVYGIAQSRTRLKQLSSSTPKEHRV